MGTLLLTPIADCEVIKSMEISPQSQAGPLVCAFENIAALLVPHPENDYPCLYWAPIFN